MTRTIFSQIMYIRDTGETNMFDVRTVQAIAIRENFHELVFYIQDHPKEYCNFILTGKAKKEDGTDFDPEADETDV